MRVLFDEHLPRQLARFFDQDVTVLTVGQRGWNGIKNGALLRAAEAEFDVFVTTDKGIPHQQHVQSFAIGIVVLRAPRNRLEDLTPLMVRVNTAIRTLQHGEVIVVTA